MPAGQHLTVCCYVGLEKGGVQKVCVVLVSRHLCGALPKASAAGAGTTWGERHQGWARGQACGGLVGGRPALGPCADRCWARFAQKKEALTRCPASLACMASASPDQGHRSG